MTRSESALRSLATRVLWPGFLGSTAPDWLLRATEDGLPGAVYFGGNVAESDPVGLGDVSRSLTAVGGPLLLGVDEEGGDVTRLEAATGSTLPGAAQLGALDDVATTRAFAADLGGRVRRSGATMALAPVADVNTDPRNPIIGVRSFGADATLVARHVDASVRGLADAGVLSCAKHFPGHGDTTVDSHVGLPRVELSYESLAAEHLPPFTAAVRAGVDAIMTSHIVFPAFGSSPATLNRRILGLVRETGFDGLIVTDALDMAAIRATVGMGPGAVQALAAGADLLCIGNPATSGDTSRSDVEQFELVRAAIVSALSDGTLDIERVEEAIGRIDAARARVGRPARTTNPIADVGTVLDAAVVVTGVIPRLTGDPLVIDARRHATGVVVDYTEPFSAALGGHVESVGCRPDAAHRAAAIARDADPHATLLILADALPSEPGQHAVIDAVRAVRPDAVVVDVGTPGEVTGPAVQTRGANRATAQWLARWMSRSMPS